MGYSLRRPAATVGVFALAFAVATAAQLPPNPPAKPDGLLHTELSLLGRTASVAFASDLQANDAANRGLFAPASQTPARVRIGELQTNGALRLGSVAVAKPGRFNLFVEAGSDGWQLDVTPAGASDSLGKLALSRDRSAVASPNPDRGAHAGRPRHGAARADMG